jgi:uncharacterized membrane protein YfcA
MQNAYDFIVLIGAGVFAGFVNTIAGGGSLLTLPLLIFMGLPAAVANGTNRIAIVVSTLSANIGYASKKVITYPFSIYLGISALFGAILGARIAIEVNGVIFNRILAIIMVTVVLIMVFKPKMATHLSIERTTGKHLLISLFVFFFIGIYGGFINAGIGFIIMLFLNLFNRMNLVRVNAAKVGVAFIYTIGALATFAQSGNVNWLYGLILAVGTSIGAWTALKLSIDRGERFIKLVMILMVVFMALKLWFFQ